MINVLDIHREFSILNRLYPCPPKIIVVPSMYMLFRLTAQTSRQLINPPRGVNGMGGIVVIHLRSDVISSHPIYVQ